MINEDTIKEIYKKFRHPAKKVEDLRIPYFVDLLSEHNPINHNGKEIEIVKLEEFSPFKRFLVRSINAILEFDRMVAFVFKNHIIFLGKENDIMQIHLRPEKHRNIFSKIFGSKD